LASKDEMIARIRRGRAKSGDAITSALPDLRAPGR